MEIEFYDHDTSKAMGITQEVDTVPVAGDNVRVDVHDFVVTARKFVYTKDYVMAHGTDYHTRNIIFLQPLYNK